MRELGLFHAKFVGRIGAVLCALVAAGTATAGASTVVPATQGRQDQVLSNETTFTRWAYVDQMSWIHRGPSTSSPTVARLTWYTADGFPSIYVLLGEHWDASGREWVKLADPRTPERPHRVGSSVARWVRSTSRTCWWW